MMRSQGPNQGQQGQGQGQGQNIMGMGPNQGQGQGQGGGQGQGQGQNMPQGGQDSRNIQGGRYGILDLSETVCTYVQMEYLSFIIYRHTIFY